MASFVCLFIYFFPRGFSNHKVKKEMKILSSEIIVIPLEQPNFGIIRNYLCMTETSYILCIYIILVSNLRLIQPHQNNQTIKLIAAS